MLQRIVRAFVWDFDRVRAHLFTWPNGLYMDSPTHSFNSQSYSPTHQPLRWTSNGDLSFSYISRT